jgi:hypothetical protein
VSAGPGLGRLRGLYGGTGSEDNQRVDVNWAGWARTPAAFTEWIRFLPWVQKTNPRSGGGEAFGSSRSAPIGERLRGVVLHVLLNSRHYESADAVGLDSEAIARLD